MALARLFLKRDWQATHHHAGSVEGVTLLFPMNELFEAYVAAQFRRAFAGNDIEVVAQGGLRYCLGEWRHDADCHGTVFQTRPDLLLRRHGRVIAVIDTKWKAVGADPSDRKHGVAQGDVYQMMAYARLYACEELMLLYPAPPGSGSKVQARFGLHGGTERLSLARVDLAEPRPSITAALSAIVKSTIRSQPPRSLMEQALAQS